MAEPVVEVEELVSGYVNASNGASPMWCYGSPVIVRDGHSVFVTIPETNTELDGLCKTRWRLFRRDEDGWSLQQHGAEFDEREPCPLVRLPGGRLIMSANPLADRTAVPRQGRCNPQLLVFDTADPKSPPESIVPKWDRDYGFSEHSYRGIGANFEEDAVLALNIDAYDGYGWSLLDETGQWVRQGKIQFPIRACYPQVAIQGGAAHVLAVGDIIETNEEWGAYKREETGREWDYDFRRLFYTWTEDIYTTEFQQHLEVASHEATAGHIRNLDMWIDDEGAAHILYATKNIWHDFMRDRFFLGTPILSTLEYCVIKAGKIVEARNLGTHTKDESEDASRQTGTSYYCGGAFHVDRVGAARIVFATQDGDTFIQQVHPRVDAEPERLNIKRQIPFFFIPTLRMGSEISDVIDLFGPGPDSGELCYVRIRL